VDLFEIGFGADAPGFEGGDFLFKNDNVVAGSGMWGGRGHKQARDGGLAI